MNIIEILAGFKIANLPVILVIYLVLHIGVAVALWQDATELKKRGSLFLRQTWIWAFAAIIFGPIIAFAYWIIHYSYFANRNDN